MNRIRAVTTLFSMLAVTGCVVPFAAQLTATSLPATSTSAPSPTTQPTVSAGPPDLTVRVWTSVAPPVCLGPHSRPGAMVTVANSGQSDAGPFMVEVNGILQAVADGLKAGESRKLWFDGRAFDTPWARMEVIVDPANQVIEVDETNNTSSEPVATLTAPAPCPTVTPVPMVTPTG